MKLVVGEVREDGYLAGDATVAKDSVAAFHAF
jgi:hypothetical protein